MKDALYDVEQSHIQITEPLNLESDIAKHLAEHGPRGVSRCLGS
jgi:hypothetical protein